MGVLAAAGANEISRVVNDEVAKHGGDPWRAVRALLEANELLEIQLEGVHALVSRGYTRQGQPTEH